jgi:tRNA C32,U32 (ribose-2'-O)-methylase TrmJ
MSEEKKEIPKFATLKKGANVNISIPDVVYRSALTIFLSKIGKFSEEDRNKFLDNMRKIAPATNLEELELYFFASFIVAVEDSAKASDQMVFVNIEDPIGG